MRYTGQGRATGHRKSHWREPVRAVHSLCVAVALLLLGHVGSMPLLAQHELPNLEAIRAEAAAASDDELADWYLECIDDCRPLLDELAHRGGRSVSRLTAVLPQSAITGDPPELITELDDEFRSEYAEQEAFAADLDDPTLLPFSEEEYVAQRQQSRRWGRAMAAAAALKAIGDPSALDELEAARDAAAQEGRQDVVPAFDDAVQHLQAEQLRVNAPSLVGRRQPVLGAVVAGLALLIGAVLLIDRFGKPPRGQGPSKGTTQSPPERPPEEDPPADAQPPKVGLTEDEQHGKKPPVAEKGSGEEEADYEIYRDDEFVDIAGVKVPVKQDEAKD